MYKEFILSLMVAAGMQSAIAGSEQLTVTFTGEVMPACEISTGNNASVDFGQLPSGKAFAESFTFSLLCTDRTIVKIYPINQFTYFYGDETLKFSVMDEELYRLSDFHLDDSISQSNYYEGRVDFNGADFKFVVGVQGEGEDFIVPFHSRSRNLGKALIKPQNFNVSIPIMIEYETSLY